MLAFPPPASLPLVTPPRFADTLALVEEEQNAHDDDIRSVAFSPDGTKIVSGCDDGMIKVWDAGRPLRPLSFPPSSALTPCSLSLQAHSSRSATRGGV